MPPWRALELGLEAAATVRADRRLEVEPWSPLMSFRVFGLSVTAAVRAAGRLEVSLEVAQEIL